MIKLSQKLLRGLLVLLLLPELAFAASTQLEADPKQRGIELPLEKPQPIESALAEAVRQGLIRKATEEDIQVYLAARARGAGLPDRIIPERLDRDYHFEFQQAYVILSPDFIIPAGLRNWQDTLILPEGLPQPQCQASYCDPVYSVAQAKSPQTPRKRGTFVCGFPDLNLPPDLKVYAAGSEAGSKLDLEVGWAAPRIKATLMQITVNSPEEPVALILGADQPTIWHLCWTKGTRISAVVVSGRGAPLVMGLPEGVPILNTYYHDLRQCPWFEVTPSVKNLTTIDDLSHQLFKKEVYMVYYAQDGRALIGPPPGAEMELETEEEFRLEKFTDPDKPLTLKAAVEQAERQGLIRKAAEEDILQYLGAVAQGAGLSDQVIADGLRPDLGPIKSGPFGFDAGLDMYNPYVVISPDFVLRAELFDPRYASFIWPEGLPRPRLKTGVPRVFSVAEAKTQPMLYKRRRTKACHIPGLKLPAELKVYAGSGFSGSKVNLTSGDENRRVNLVPITVNSPQTSAALLLETSKPTIWQISWTEGTEISAVVVSSHFEQRIVGLPKEVPVLLNTTSNNYNQCYSFFIPSSLKHWYRIHQLSSVNDLSNHLFNKDIDKVYYAHNAQSVIGEPLNDEMKIVTSDELGIEDLSGQNKPSLATPIEPKD